MATYVMSDIHGEYEQFLKILEMIDFKESDTLYILGDIMDRGKHPITIFLKIMEMDNVHFIIGNHELMFIECFDFLNSEITYESISKVDEDTLMKFISWQQNGGQSTIDELYELDRSERLKIKEFILNSDTYEVITIHDKRFVLVHASLGDKSRVEDCTLHDLIWTRNEYQPCYDENTWVISGHTPTLAFSDHENKGYICKFNNHYAIDCGACFQSGRLGCLCLDTLEEYYSR